MDSKKPIIKYNNGNPIALCNRCFCIMCFVVCDNWEFNEGDNCVVLERKTLGNIDVISTPIGRTPPLYCNKCNDLLNNYMLN